MINKIEGLAGLHLLVNLVNLISGDGSKSQLQGKKRTKMRENSFLELDGVYIRENVTEHFRFRKAVL